MPVEETLVKVKLVGCAVGDEACVLAFAEGALVV
jgi:hypothetical protein